mmetsp:Transcript_17862/g.47087  ORF Transcript_17862/g.47087 Transcript_17862/m.47087 type:complete len:222 (+) Transcript_17862:59-724(+)
MPNVLREHVQRLLVKAPHHILAADTEQRLPPCIQGRSPTLDQRRVRTVGDRGAEKSIQRNLLGDVPLEANAIRPIQGRVPQVQHQALAHEEHTVFLPVHQNRHAHARARVRHHDSASLSSLSRKKPNTRICLPQGQADSLRKLRQGLGFDHGATDDVPALFPDDVGGPVAVGLLETRAGIADREALSLRIAQKEGALTGEVRQHTLRPRHGCWVDKWNWWR